MSPHTVIASGSESWGFKRRIWSGAQLVRNCLRREEAGTSPPLGPRHYWEARFVPFQVRDLLGCGVLALLQLDPNPESEL